ncbi:MAG: cytochrome c [Gemmatimonadetes bacterium]|jgi:cytochrome c oxidase cbb3-type subunit 3|nr:cytochrome c [Gemmatimonadota bacterium]
MRLTNVAVAVGVGLVLSAGTLLGQEPDGKALYEANCAQCHGKDGVPPEVLASRIKALKPLNDPSIYQGVSEDSTVAVLENGIGIMQPFKGTLDHEQEVAIARYIRTLAKPDTAKAAIPEKRPTGR